MAVVLYSVLSWLCPACLARESNNWRAKRAGAGQPGLIRRADARRLGGPIVSTVVRFKIVDGLHGIDSTGVQAFSDDLDTEKDQHHATPQ